MPLHRRFALLLLALCLPLVHAVAMRGFMLADLHTAGADRALVWVEGTPAQLDALASVVDARHGRVPAGRVRSASHESATRVWSSSPPAASSANCSAFPCWSCASRSPSTGACRTGSFRATACWAPTGAG